jgi:hypothetical protein
MKLEKCPIIYKAKKMKDVGSLVVRKRQSRKIFVVKKSINAGKVHRTGILKLMHAYIPVLCTSCLNYNL